MKTFRILNPDQHGALDYLAAAGLVLLPFALGLDALPRWLSVGAGVLLVAYSLISDYALALAPVLSFRTHLLLDGLAAAAFVAAPFVFGFTGVTAAYFFVMAAGVVAVVALSDPGPARGRRRRPVATMLS